MIGVLRPTGLRPKFVEKIQDLSNYVEYFEADVLGPFQGYEYYPDKEFPEWEQALWEVLDPKDQDVRDHWGIDERIRQRQLENRNRRGRGRGRGSSMGGDPYSNPGGNYPPYGG